MENAGTICMGGELGSPLLENVMGGIGLAIEFYNFVDNWVDGNLCELHGEFAALEAADFE